MNCQIVSSERYSESLVLRIERRMYRIKARLAINMSGPKQKLRFCHYCRNLRIFFDSEFETSISISFAVSLPRGPFGYRSINVSSPCTSSGLLSSLISRQSYKILEGFVFRGPELCPCGRRQALQKVLSASLATYVST